MVAKNRKLSINTRITVGVFCLLAVAVGNCINKQINAVDSFVLSSKLIEYVVAHDKRLPNNWLEYATWVSKDRKGRLSKSLANRFELAWGARAESFYLSQPLITAKKNDFQSDAKFIDRRVKDAFTMVWISNRVDSASVKGGVSGHTDKQD